jgi:small subunit ribosomal protein S20
VNKRAESKLKTVYNKALKSTDKTEAEKLYKEAVSILDRSAAKGFIPKNNASRKKAALTRYFNSLSTPPAEQ